MAKRKSKSHSGRGGLKVSLAPLNPNEALRLALNIRNDDVKRLEDAEKRGKGRRAK